jgi:dihydroorotase
VRPYDTVIRGGLLISPSGRRHADIAISGGRIAAVVEPGGELDADATINADGLAVMPGVIDVHEHHREPGYTHKEDIVTGTAAAAAGGVTTAVAMPNVDPPPNRPELLEAMFSSYEAKAIVDWNVNPAGVIPDQIPALAAMGVLAIKVFMVGDTQRSYPHMPGIGVHDHGKLLEIFDAVAETGLPLMVHPHDQAIMRYLEEGYWARGERDFRAYAKAYSDRDGIIWDTATAVLLRLQQASGARLHVLHTQTTGMLEQIARAKSAGRPVTAEINSWGLFLGNEWANIERLGSYALAYYVPEKNTEPLWQALRDGTVDIFASDHGPHLREEKEPGWTDGWKAHTGVPSAQFYFPLLLDAAARGRLSLERVVEVTSFGPARLFRLGSKGRLEVGADADIVLVDLEADVEITDEMVVSKCAWTPFAGRRVRGSPVATLVRGHTVQRNGEILAEPGWGKQAKPSGPTTPEPVAS